MPHRLDILLVGVFALALVDCKHTPSEQAADTRPVDNCLTLLDSDESLTMDTPFVATGPVITFDAEPVPAPEFRRFSMLYADVMAPRSPRAVVEAFATYWVGKKLADAAGVEVSRGEVEARVGIVEQRFPDQATYAHFLDDAGMTPRKLRAAVCRDLRLEKYAEGLQEPDNDAEDPHARRGQRATVLTPRLRETLEQARVDRTASVPRTEVTSSLTRDYTTPLTGEFTELSFGAGGWTTRFHLDDGHQLDGLDHSRLMLLRDRENRVRLEAETYPHILYLADERLVLSATREDEPSVMIRIEGGEGAPELSADNHSASTWIRPLGTLPLTYIDVLRRKDVREPAVTPRGKRMGVRLVYACATGDESGCIEPSFAIDILDEEHAETWAIFQYPSVDGERVYTRHCATCHGPDGGGLEQTHPPLVGTRWTTGLLGPRALVESVALGTHAESLSGETTIQGETYESELMPRFVDHLEPRQVRAVVNYIASSWGNDGPQVTEADVIDVYCDNGVDVVYRARVDEDRMERLVDKARRDGDCAAQVRAEIDSLQEPVSDDAMERAEMLYDANCAACHGAEGRGDGPAAAGLHPAPTDFTDPDGWKHGTSLTAAFLSIAEGNAGAAMQSYAERFNHTELRALAQMTVRWLPEAAAAKAPGDDALLEYCRAETERRRLEWDRCEER
jgi:mono/diheme cytochrome c family protein